MNITRINAINMSFKGLLTISGPNKECDVILNTDNVSTILKQPYFDKKENSAIGVGTKQGAVITMNNGTIINTFLPVETVIDAYKKAKVANEYKLEAKFDPVAIKPMII